MTFEEWWKNNPEIDSSDKGLARIVWTDARSAFVADVRKHLPCRCRCWPGTTGIGRRVPNPNCPWHAYAVELLTEEEFKSC